jgi:hypothetical protein
MTAPTSRNGAHMVRFSEDGKAIFWGNYDQNGDFTGQGSANIEAPGTEPHTLQIRLGTDTYSVVLDGTVITENVPLQSKQGHIGLTSSESVVAFEQVQIER